MLNKREAGNKVSGGGGGKITFHRGVSSKKMTGTKGYTVDSLFKGHPRD